MLIVASARRDFQLSKYIKEEDSKIVSIQAACSYLATSGPPQSSSGANTLSREASLMVERGSFITGSSLLALSSPLSSHATESVSTGMDGRDLDQHSSSLQCPFRFLDCYKEFSISHEEEWIKHSLTHFVKKPRRGRTPVQVQPPKRCRCCFCGAEFRAVSGVLCWRDRMSHAMRHHQRTDFAHFEYEYFWQQGIIPEEVYRELKPKQSLPTPPSSDDEKSPIAFRGETR